MLLFYVDESGDASVKREQDAAGQWTLKSGTSEWFVLAACGIQETMRGSVAQDIARIKDRYLPGWRSRPWEETELKGRYLAQAAARLASGKKPGKPKGFSALTSTTLPQLCESLAALFRKYRPVVYAIAIDKRAEVKKAAPRAPVGVAYTFLQQRMALLVQSVFGGVGGAMIIADEQQIHERYFRSGDMLALRAAITTPLRIQPNFELILDRPMWINPNWHPLDREILQLPDLVAYAVREAVHTGSAPSGATYMWNDVERCFARHWVTGAIADAGVAIYPRPHSYPQGI